jgi:peptidoglycan/xylan/chitin deacetylase (PgdA/CDA1 family)
LAARFKSLRNRLALRMRLRRALGRPAGPAILMYHRIAAAEFDPWRLAVAPENFEDQLVWLKRRRQVVSLADFARLHLEGRLPQDAVAITFDDGYACNAEVAAPLLERHGLPATIFLTTAAPTSGREFWWDELERLLLEAPAGELPIRVEDATVVVRFDGRAGFASGGAREAAYQAIWAELIGLPPDEREQAIEALAAQLGVPAGVRPTHRAMTEDQVRALARSPQITIGAHTVRHPALTKLPQDARRAEIAQSREACAALIGAPPAAFAYPYGDVNPTVVEDVRAEGFEVAVTTDGALVSGPRDPLALPRLQVEDWPGRRLNRLLTPI